MKVLVVGSGGREHALVWKIAQSEALTSLHAAPGSKAIGRLATCHADVKANDLDAIVALAGRFLRLHSPTQCNKQSSVLKKQG